MTAIRNIRNRAPTCATQSARGGRVLGDTKVREQLPGTSGIELGEMRKIQHSPHWPPAALETQTSFHPRPCQPLPATRHHLSKSSICGVHGESFSLPVTVIAAVGNATVIVVLVGDGRVIVVVVVVVVVTKEQMLSHPATTAT